jgi:hypothetical protein
MKNSCNENVRKMMNLYINNSQFSRPKSVSSRKDEINHNNLKVPNIFLNKSTSLLNKFKTSNLDKEKLYEDYINLKCSMNNLNKELKF